MAKRRVVITGLGVVAPNGIGIEAFWKTLLLGESGIRRISRFDASTYPCQIAGEVDGFVPTDYMSYGTAKSVARFAQFAVAASKMAVEDAKTHNISEDPYRTGVYVGTGMGGGEKSEEQLVVYYEKGLKRLSPQSTVAICNHSAVGAISLELGIKGPNSTVSSGCCSGLDAVVVAYHAIQSGDIDIAVVSGADAPISPFSLGLFCAGRFLSKNNGEPAKALRPFDLDRDGTVLGEGGGSVILEDLQHGLNRGALIYGEILGYSSINESYSLTEIETTGDSLATGIKRALLKGGLNPEDIDYINAHGNGLIQYDISETLAIKKALGRHARRVFISSIKPIVGQSFSATGIFQLITCLLVIQENTIPPTANYKKPDPHCDLDYVPTSPIHVMVDRAMMNSHGFGGSHTVLIVGRYKD